MSMPVELNISYNADRPVTERFTKVVMNKAAASALFEYMYARFDNIGSDYKNQLHGEFWSYFFSICDSPKQRYPAVCALIMQACADLALVKPYQAELQATLQSDPRYQQQETACPSMD